MSVAWDEVEALNRQLTIGLSTDEHALLGELPQCGLEHEPGKVGDLRVDAIDHRPPERGDAWIERM